MIRRDKLRQNPVLAHRATFHRQNRKVPLCRAVLPNHPRPLPNPLTVAHPHPLPLPPYRRLRLDDYPDTIQPVLSRTPSTPSPEPPSSDTPNPVETVGRGPNSQTTPLPSFAFEKKPCPTRLPLVFLAQDLFGPSPRPSRPYRALSTLPGLLASTSTAASRPPCLPLSPP